jgi:hypothetical protein
MGQSGRPADCNPCHVLRRAPGPNWLNPGAYLAESDPMSSLQKRMASSCQSDTRISGPSRRVLLRRTPG